MLGLGLGARISRAALQIARQGKEADEAGTGGRWLDELMHTLWRGCTLRETNEDAGAPEDPTPNTPATGMEFRSELPVEEQEEHQLI